MGEEHYFFRELYVANQDREAYIFLAGAGGEVSGQMDWERFVS